MSSMVTPEPHLRIPGSLVPSYQRLISTEEGKTAMKRIRVECGVCKATRFYSIHRGITRIAGVVACEACRQFYQRFKKQPWVVDCVKGGKCYELDETPKNKCKACWVAHIICRCPVSVNLYNNLIGYLPTELKAKMAARPPTVDEVPESKRGGLGLEVYKDESWVDVTDKSEVDSLLRDDDMNDSDEGNEQEEMEFEAEADEEEENVDDPGIPDEDSNKSTPASEIPGGKSRRTRKSRTSSVDPDERLSEQSTDNNKESEEQTTCVIHCTDANDNLMRLRKLKTWETLKKAAIIREHPLATTEYEIDPDTEIPIDMYYHRRCYAAFTVRSGLEGILRKQVKRQSRSLSKQRRNSNEEYQNFSGESDQEGMDQHEDQSRNIERGTRMVMASLIEGLHVNNQNKFMENFNPKTSERVKRKKKKVQYFTASGRTKAPGSQVIYGPDGTLVHSGKDLCDCLQGDCPGCHYPCPKCSSRKCGTECRMNRKWYYEKVEVEGTKLYWMNDWIQKKV